MSPIKGLTERRRLPRLGKIHLGVKKQNAQGVEYPAAVDYFVCPPEVQKVFGEKPKELRILIPVEDEEKWASQYYRLYTRTRGLICKGDGDKAVRLFDTETNQIAFKDTAKKVDMRDYACKGKECPEYAGAPPLNKKLCKEIMNLQFLLPEVPGIGIWQIDTGSINSIQNINSGADIIKQLYGRKSLIPLALTIEPMQVKNPDDGKLKQVYVLNLRTKDRLGDLVKIATKPLDQMLLDTITGEIVHPDEIGELPTPDDETPELIIPEAQASKEQEPLLDTDKDFEKMKSVTEIKPVVKATVKQAAKIHVALKDLELSTDTFKVQVLQHNYGVQKITDTLTITQADKLIGTIDLLKSEKITGLKAVEELQKLK